MFITSFLGFLFFSSMALMSLLPLMSTAISLGTTILSLSMFFCLLVGFASSSWFAYVLFLIYVGGLMVMFIYVCLLSSNYIFLNIPMSLVFSSLLICFFFSLSSSFQIFSFPVNPKTTPENFVTGAELVETSNLSILLTLAILLFVNLLAVVAISGSSSLRTYEGVLKTPSPYL